MTKETLDSREVGFNSPYDEYTRYTVGWLSPEGKFYYTTCSEHLSFAREAGKLLYDEESPRGDDVLYAHGWCATHPHGLGHELLFTWRGHLTEEQKAVIKPYVEDYGKWVSDLNRYDLYRELDLEYQPTGDEIVDRFASTYREEP